MSNLSDRISYLRGLAEGLKVDTQSNEGRLIAQLIEVLSDVIEDVDALHDEVDELGDYVESIDDDLSELEEDFGDDFDDDDDEDDDDDDDLDFLNDLDDDEEDDEDLDDVLSFFARGDSDDPEDDASVSMYLGCACPKCGGMFCIDATEGEGDQLFVCPHCSETVEAKPMGNDMPIAHAITEDDED